MQFNSKWLNWEWSRQVAHSDHVSVRFVAVTWDELPPLESIEACDDDSDNVNYRQSRNSWREPTEPDDSD